MLSELIPYRDLQEDLLLLLCFDSERARTVRSLIAPQYFDPPYNNIVGLVIRYIDKYGDAPGDALPTLLDPLLSSNNPHLAESAKQSMLQLFENRSNVNAKYAIDRLNVFIRRQTMRLAVLETAELIQGREIDDEKIDQAELILSEAARKRSEVFSPGIFLGDSKSALRFLDRSETATFPTGIPELDQRSAGPVRGGLHLFIAPAKAGKTHFLCNLGKHAMMHRLNVAHVTLEMDEPRIIGRYLQTLFSVSNRSEATMRTDFELDDLRRFAHLIRTPHTSRLSLDSSNIRDELRDRIERMAPRLKRIVVKEFPTGSLTIRELEAYLDLLADMHSYKPDLLLLDYADLMRFTDDFRDFRLSLGNLYKDLRGMAARRDIAIATVTQATRSSSRSGRVGAEDVAEDWSKIATADVVLTYGQTPAERELGLARITVAAGRNDEDKFSVVISQHYTSGQFCLQSARLNSTYYDRLNEQPNSTEARREAED